MSELEKALPGGQQLRSTMTGQNKVAKPVHSLLGGIALLVLPTIVALPLFGLLLWRFVSHLRTSTARDNISNTVGLCFVAWLLTSFVMRLARVGRSLMAVDATALMVRDHRTPVVYLRPFEEDTRLISSDPEGPRIGGIVVSHIRITVARHLKRL